MNIQTLVVAATSAAILGAGCTGNRNDIAECPGMPVRGWDQLLKREPFSRMKHKRETLLDPMSATSKLLLGDSNYEYRVLLTYVFSYPQSDKANQFEAGCVQAASLLVREPVDDTGAAALSAFLRFLQEGDLPTALTRETERAALARGPLARIGSFGDAEVLAGTIEQGARGRFSRVEIRSRVLAPDSLPDGAAK